MSAITPKFKAYVSLITICLVWGGTFLAVSVGIESLPPLFLSGFRQVISGTLLVIIFSVFKGQRVEKTEWKKIVLFGACIVFFSNTLVIWSIKFLPTGLAALLMTSIPIWITVLNLFMKGRWPGAFVVAGLVAGIAGIALIFSDSTSSLCHIGGLLSVGVLLAGTLFWALGSVLIGDTAFVTPPFLIAGIQLFVFGVLLVLVSYAVESWEDISFPESALGSLFYLIVLDQMLAYAAYIYALRILPVTLVSIFVYVNPIVALFLGWLVKDEPFTFRMMIATAIIFISVYFLNREQS